ncbi:hypothetical protein SAMN02745157_0531 [Kaistia soli DSM 19436]|uniref:Uncharacterized protein n=2 Tax=Kaistia TaxID=166953 RepID=A0A1M4UT47_9HYPH|nr:hypothetical protein SAMN02745157_0531 [Kaistia soli DSM 19436]
MRRGQVDEEPGSAPSGIGRCPISSTVGAVSKSDFERWRDNDVRCSAGKREFQLGRYMVEHVRNGYQFLTALECFRSEVEAHRKTGFLAIVPSTETDYADSLGELRRLGEIMTDAGFADSPGALINAQTIAIPFEIECPVTGLPATYEFFPVAFCRHAATIADPLYDPSLSAPFLAINTTSDAFALGMLVKDLSKRHFHCEPHQIEKRADFERLLHRCATAWQNMSENTISMYNRISAIPQRAVALSEDHRSWTAPHNDPVFAETAKETHSHEMPVVYAERLCRKWIAARFEGAAFVAGRDGQSGGMYVPVQDIVSELHF